MHIRLQRIIRANQLVEGIHGAMLPNRCHSRRAALSRKTRGPYDQSVIVDATGRTAIALRRPQYRQRDETPLLPEPGI
jgi:hypothetical protein